MEDALLGMGFSPHEAYVASLQEHASVDDGVEWILANKAAIEAHPPKDGSRIVASGRDLGAASKLFELFGKAAGVARSSVGSAAAAARSVGATREDEAEWPPSLPRISYVAVSRNQDILAEVADPDIL
jgi:hypothetical protein